VDIRRKLGSHIVTRDERQARWVEIRAEAYEGPLARHEVAPAAAPSRLSGAEELRLKNYVDTKIAAALAARDEHWRDVLGALVSEVRKQLRAEISAEVGLLRADLTIEKAAANDRNGVVRLPSWFNRRRAHDAAH
jgi:hypothetical protein